MSETELAIIFDMDGVLVDTFDAHFESWNVAAAREGATITRQQFHETFGRTSRETITTLWPEKDGDDEAIGAFDDLKETAFREIITRDFPAMPGVHRLRTPLTALSTRIARLILFLRIPGGLDLDQVHRALDPIQSPPRQPFKCHASRTSRRHAEGS